MRVGKHNKPTLFHLSGFVFLIVSICDSQFREFLLSHEKHRVAY